MYIHTDTHTHTGEGNGNPLQYSCLENPHGQRSLAGHSPWGRKESDMTKQLTLHYYTIYTQMYIFTYLISHVQPYGEALWRVR